MNTGSSEERREFVETMMIRRLSKPMKSKEQSKYNSQTSGYFALRS
jgi:hypothetical protein